MNKKIILSALTAATMAASWAANATLEPRLNGQAYYDTETDLTWTTTMNPNGNKTINEHLYLLSNLVIDGISNWRIPTESELIDISHKSTDCSWPTVCYPNGTFDASNADTWFYYLTSATEDKTNFYAHGSDGKFYFMYSPWWNEFSSFPFDGNEYPHSAWPVHTGDIAAISQVPEPSTYAMLLAGLGLLGFMARRRKDLEV